MTGRVQGQRGAFEDGYRLRDQSAWGFHYTKDPLMRYLRDRRLIIGLELLRQLGTLDVRRQSILVVCGGVGGEGTFLRNYGFEDVTVSDFSTEALRMCRQFDPRLKTTLLDVESIDLPDSSVDIVLVQDGLHHLPRPVLGFTEMLRVARHAAIVIEPHAGLVGQTIGTRWEVQGDAVNYVFRWNATLLEQSTHSYLLSPEAKAVARRVWDHSVAVTKVVSRLPRFLRLHTAKAIYALLRPFSRAGNMMVGVVVKPTPRDPGDHTLVKVGKTRGLSP